MLSKIGNAFMFVLLGAMLMSFVDVLWIFGVENSQQYTIWAAIAHFGQ